MLALELQSFLPSPSTYPIEDQWKFQGGRGGKNKLTVERYGAKLNFLEGGGCKPNHLPPGVGGCGTTQKIICNRDTWMEITAGDR